MVKKKASLGFPTANVLPENDSIFLRMASMQSVLQLMARRMMVSAM